MKFIPLLIVGLTLVFQSAANAAIINANLTVDLDQVIAPNGFWVRDHYLLEQPVTAESGDTIVFTIDFLENQYLTWGGDGLINPWLAVSYWTSGGSVGDPSHQGSFSWTNGSISFENLIEGDASTINVQTSGSSSSVHAGLTNALRGNGSPYTFSSMTTQFDISWTDGDVNREYDGIWTSSVFSGSLSASTVDVSAPSAFAIMGLGILGLGFSRRR
jgi:hypothetical protein